jgi:Tfp pilus assembly protein PilN
MINLLPPDYRQSLTYARRNTALLRLAMGLGVGAIGIAIVIFTGQMYLQQSIRDHQTSIDDTKARLTAQDQTATLKRVQGISSSINLALTVLSREVLFSKLLKQIGTVMPPGTVLQDLSVDGALTGGINLEAGATSYEAASQVQVNLADPANKIFQKADILDTACDTPDPEKPNPYPCHIKVRALFSTDNPFLFLSEEKTP